MKSLSRLLRSAVLGAAIVAPLAVSAQTNYFTVSQIPLILPQALTPNLLITMDDTLNMQWAFPENPNAFPYANSPTAYGSAAGCGNGNITFSGTSSNLGTLTLGSQCPYNTRRFKAANFNPMYYNPAASYRAPPNAPSSISFNGARNNGFFNSSSTVNLSNAYRPTVGFNPGFPSTSAPTETQAFADHACFDRVAGRLGNVNANVGTAAYYYVYDPSNPTPANTGNLPSGCNAPPACTGSNISPANDACYRLVTVAVNSPEAQNFANWYSYYRTRHLAAISAAAIAMNDPSLAGVRVGWQGLTTGTGSCSGFLSSKSNCVGYTTSATRVTNIPSLLDVYTTNAQAAADPSVGTIPRQRHFYRWLRGLPASGAATDLRDAMRSAGEYFATTSAATTNNPYRLFPQGAGAGVSNPEYACRPNFHVMITGNAWTDRAGGNTAPCGSGAGTCGNQDGTAATLPAPAGGTSTSYPSTQRPFTDTYGNTLSDVAFYYWSRDLRTDLDNNLTPYYRDRSGASAGAQFMSPQNDPAQWQHMVNFIVGVGVTGSLDDPNIPWSGNSFSGSGYAALLAGTQNWPDPFAASNATRARIYDLWHAALNSRGQFFPSNRADEVADAVVNSLARTIERSRVGAAIATNSSRLSTDSVLYQASYSTVATATPSSGAPYQVVWSGQLLALDVNTDGSVGGTLWTAGFPNSRTILSSSQRVGGGFTFDWTSLGTAGLQNRFGSQAMVDYLRGDGTGEQRNGGSFRNRPSTPLGDIVNSEIVFSYGENFGYEVLTEGLSSGATPYTTFLTNKSSRTPLLFVGSNGGMLHAFDASTGSTNSGRERFAYVPRTLVNEPVSVTDSRSALVNLADPAYSHRFYVDGSPWVGDAFWGGSWRTVLLGSTGAGGRGVFAIDITNAYASNVSTGNVLWDLDGAEDPDLGYTLGQPVIGRLPDGNWYAVFGNGYRSTNDCAVLYLVRLNDGAIRRISTNVSTNNGNMGTGNTPAASACNVDSGSGVFLNGLGRASLFSRADNRITDTIYAGDLRGNVWRFDVSDANPNNWGVGIRQGGNLLPLFTATNAAGQPQPVTGGIELGAAPGGQSGVMVYFGTGRYFAVNDQTDTTTQAFYGILDGFASGQSAQRTCTWTGSGATATCSTLVRQTITETGSGASATRAISANTVPYSASGNNARFGFFLELPSSGERMVTMPLLLPGRLLFATVFPGADICQDVGRSWVMAIDPVNGAKFPTSLFINGGGDAVYSTVGAIRNLIAIDGGTRVYVLAGGADAGPGGSYIQKIDTLPYSATGGLTRGRTSWREVNR